jgi:hypothetical protein
VDVPRPWSPGEGDRDVVDDGRDREGRVGGVLKASSKGRIWRSLQERAVEADVVGDGDG